MSRIPESTIHEIRSRGDIVALVSRYVELKQAGRNWKGLCPFHNEKTPSFNVNSDRQIFHCFGCQEGGDVIGFLMKHEGLSFPEAARNLAAEHGIEVPEDRDGRDAGLTSRIFEANQLAQALYRESLRTPEGKIARAYLVARGFDGETADEFGIGFAPARLGRGRRAAAREADPGRHRCPGRSARRAANPGRATTTGCAAGSPSRSRTCAAG